MKKNKKIIFLCKNTLFCDYAINILKTCFNENHLLIFKKSKNKKLPKNIKNFNFDYIISFLCPLIIPKNILEKTKKAAINFHPGSPDYPGTGCYNFALYENSEKYGVTCHHMDENIDSGKIIMTSDFEIQKNETVESLKLKSMIHLLYIFEKIINLISQDKKLPISEKKWKRKAFTKKKLDNLCKIDPRKMSKKEIQRRIKSTTYPGAPGPYKILKNKKIPYPVPKKKPIA